MNEEQIANILLHIGSFAFFVILITIVCLVMSFYEDDFTKRQ